MNAFFDSREFEEDPFHQMEIQVCGETKTVQFGITDTSGDGCNGSCILEGVGAVALTFEDFKKLSEWATAAVERAIETGAVTGCNDSRSNDGPGQPRGHRTSRR